MFKKRLLYTLALLLFLLLSILIINWRTPPQRANEVVAVSSTPPAIVVSSQTRPPILPATILPATLAPSATPGATSRPQLANSAAITLMGPPDNSSFPQNGSVSFYWTFSEQLQPGQQFVLFMQQNGQALPLGALTEPNLGSGFQLMIDLRDVAVSGTAVWQIRLQWIGEEQWLIAAERSLTISPE
jgi:hypothetical protein